jgi:hypothetical protein
VNSLREDFKEQVEKKSQLPLPAHYNFDFSPPPSDNPKPHFPIQKTRRRTVVSLNFSKFQAREIIREEKKEDKILNHRSSDLMNIVPSGARYAYDLIAFVGGKCFLEGRKLTDIHKEFSHIPYSSLYDIQCKFLFYYGELHRQAAAHLKEYLHKRGNITWLIDGTLEPGTPVFFGVKDALEGIFLDCWKIPTENDKDISSSLRDCAERYGNPDRILHDLSERMSAGCESALADVPHFVCHCHFAGAIGKELYKEPQQLISKRLRAVKLQVRLKNQRSGQTQYLKKKIENENISLVLSDLLNGKTIDVKCIETLGREVLLALHLWMLDYPQDGYRQGYPFDPFLLYFHRRIAKAYEASKRLLSFETIQQKTLKILVNFSNQLEKYLTDSIIVEASSLYEKAYDIFERIRQALRLIGKEPNPMHGLYKLQPDEQRELDDTLHELQTEFNKESINSTDPQEKNFYKTALNYIDKYKPYLAITYPNNTVHSLERTTNGIERHWNLAKRIRRQSHGRKKLTRDFYAMPEEFMLVPNLQNPKYIEVVLGSFDKLPEKLAEAGKNAGPYHHWRNRENPLNVGRLPVRLLRDENFIDDLIGTFNASCYLD